MRAFDSRFAAVYNDTARFPTIDDVADELGVSVKTVRNRAGEMRTLARELDADTAELIDRSRGARRPKAPVEEVKTVPVWSRTDPIKPKPRAPGQGVRYFFLGAGQDGSEVHHGFMDNMEAYAAWLGDSETMISGSTYNKQLFESHDKNDADKHWWHPRIMKYWTQDQVEIGDGLLFCGEMNTLPTATNPLSGFETYTRDKWGVFPHAKVQLQSVATAKMARTKQLMTTGFVTMPNYVQKKAGIKASFHHVIGCVLVELHPDGSFFCRHLLAEDDGSFYDLDRRVERGNVTTDHRAEALVYGDIHHEKLDPIVERTTWGEGGLLDRFRPRHQFFHDLSDFTARNHHRIKDHHFRFATHAHDTANVRDALSGCAQFLVDTSRPWCRSVVVESNHDQALVTWLKTADYREDPENAVFFLECQTYYYQQLGLGVQTPPVFEHVLNDLSAGLTANIEFVGEDDTYIICGDIECAMHGHLGANGSRGSPKQFTRAGPKSISGHTHSPQIIDGAVVVGVSGSLDQGYNRGMSSWDHTHCLVYPNGKRCLITLMNGRWFA
jgi:hypothetical protein